MMRRLLFALLLVFAAVPARAGETQVCRQKLVVSVDLDMDDNGLVRVPVRLNGQPFRMLVDTGDYFSVVNRHTAKALGKKPLESDNFALVGWGGSRIDHYISVDEFALGRLKRGATQFMVMEDGGPDFDGLFGADFLYYFDLDFDFAKAKLNLISPDRCKNLAVYWSGGDYAQIPFDWKSRAIKLTVKLDGKDVEALIDTGASDTVMSLETAVDLFGIDAKKLAEAKGKHPFKELSLGGVKVLNPAIHLVPDKQSGMMGWRHDTRMILGMTVLRRLHLYIGYKEEMIYVTPATQY